MKVTEGRGAMDTGEMLVTLPFGRLIELAQYLGSQEHDVCPPNTTECWRYRDLQPYAEGQCECENCWVQYLMMGD
jgi:hypothetical protein